MVKEEVEELIIRSKCRARTWPFDPPDSGAWDSAAAHLGCIISADYRVLFELSLRYWVGLDLFGPVGDASPEGYASFPHVYADEMSNNPRWDPKMLPVCAVGNGDYFTLLIDGNLAEKVFYVYHEDDTAEFLHGSVAEWILSLPDLLNG